MKGSVLILTIRHSRLAAVILLAVQGLAAGAIGLAALPVVLQVGLIAVVGGHALWSFRRKRPELRLRCGGDGTLTVLDGGETLPATLVRDSMVWPGWVVLRYRQGTRHRTTTRMILPDALPGEDFRRLKVWLRWSAAKP